MDQDSQTAIYPLLNKGIVSKLDPALLQPGQFQTAQNIWSVQEGQISNRPGRRYLGRLPAGANDPIKLAKLPVPVSPAPIAFATPTTPISIGTENPHGFHNGQTVTITGVNGTTGANGTWTIAVTDGTSFNLLGSAGGGAYVNGGLAVLQFGDVSLRYVGVGDTIYRSLDFFQTSYPVATGVMGGQEPFANRWSMAPYSAGSTGQPQAYFATHGGMFQDSTSIASVSLTEPMQRWGILPGLAAASAQVLPPVYTAITGVTSSAGLIEISTSPNSHFLSTNNTATIAGVLGTTEANGDWRVTVIDAQHFTLNASTFTNVYISGGLLNRARFHLLGGSAAPVYRNIPGPLIGVYDPSHGFQTGEVVTINGVTGTDIDNANGTFTITLDPGTPADYYTLNNTTAASTMSWSSGGKVYRSGPDTHQDGASLYSYVFTYRDPKTGNEGNPSPVMSNSLLVDSQNQIIVVTVWGTADPKITGDQSIVVYRAGGGFSDSLYREVGRVSNVGPLPGSSVPRAITFVDFVTDARLLYARQAEFDNGPPVTSTLRYPINAKIVSGDAGPNPQPGWNTLTLTAGVYDIMTVGSTVFIGANASEACVIADIPSTHSTGANNTILVYLQLAHLQNEQVLMSAVTGQPSSLVLQAFDSLFVADDPNNPHTLYKSKTGMPESFPVIDALGHSGSINVGSPSNGIMNLCEFRGQILCLNRTGLFLVEVYQGVMYGPFETPAERGLCGQWAFCKSQNAVYYLAWDGIWMWDGSQSHKLTESIDPIFHGMAANGIAPVDYLLVQYCRMEYYRNQVFFLYRSAVNKEGRAFNYVLRYDVLQDRWIPESHNIVPFPTIHQSVTEFLYEEDTEFFIFARADPAGGVISQYDFPGIPGFTDEFTDIFGTNGVAFDCFFQTGSFRPKDAASMQLFQDALLELQSRAGGTSALMYYDFSVTADTVDQFTIASTGGVRKTVPLPLQLSGTPALPAGKEAFAVATGIGWTSGAQVTVFSFGLRYIDRDQVSSGSASDWMNFSNWHDKRFSQLLLEHNTGGQLVDYHLDCRYGLNGVLQKNDCQIFTLQSSDKTTVTLPLSEANWPNSQTIAKAIRLRAEYSIANASPQNAPGAIFRIFYKPQMEYEVLPPDVTLFTPLADLAWPCGKIARNLVIDIDTGGVACAVTAEADGVAVKTFTLTTTANDRKRNPPFTSVPSPSGKLWRLTTVPGAGGKAQLFGWSLDYTREPCDVNFWDSWELSLGYQGWKFLKQCWLEYLCASPIEVTIIVDGGRVFYVKALPAQTVRDTQRFYLPDSTGTSPVILNKSKIYRFQLRAMDNVSPIRFYEEASRFEWMPLGADQRRAYQQMNFNEATKFTATPATLADSLAASGR